MEQDFMPAKEEEIKKALEKYYAEIIEGRKDGIKSIYETSHNDTIEIALDGMDGRQRSVNITPEQMVDVIVDANMPNAEKDKYLNDLRFATAHELSGYIPQNTTINDAFINQYEADINKIEQAQQKADQAEKDFYPYRKLESDCELMSHWQQQMYRAISAQMSPQQLQTDPFCKEIGQEKINNVLKQCATEGNMKAFEEWEKNLPPHNEEMLRDFKKSVQIFIETNDKELLNTFANNYDNYVTDYKTKNKAYADASKECNETCVQMKEKYVVVSQDIVLYEEIMAVRDSGLLSSEDTQMLIRATPGILRGEQYQKFLKDATQFIQQRVPPEKLAQIQLADYQKKSIIGIFGRIPLKSTLSKLKAYNNIKKIKDGSIKLQAKENVGGKTDNSGVDKLAERAKAMEGKTPQERMAMRINELRGIGDKPKSPVHQITIARDMLKSNTNTNG